MLKEEKLDTFLDAFLGSSKCGAVDTDFFEEAEAAECGEEDTWELKPAAVVKRENRKLSKRTRAALFLIVFLIPLTMWVGINYFGDRKYLAVSLFIALFSMLPFFMIFEDRKPQARELVIIAVQAAIAVAGRAVLFMLPSCKPVAAVTIITAVSFGPESGFLVGSISMLVSNMLFGQGPWTPWQMFAMGIIGFLCGILSRKGVLKVSRKSLCLFGFLAVVFIYGGIMNPASLVMMSYDISWHNLLAIYISGLPVDLTHAGATVLFLYFGSKPMIEKLERIKVKYGLVEP